MRNQPRPQRGAVAVAGAPHGSDATRILGIVLLAAFAGAALAVAVLATGGGFLAALLSYSLGASGFAAVCVGLLLLREIGLTAPRHASPRRLGGMGRLAS
jgi:hypothetical protein